MKSVKSMTLLLIMSASLLMLGCASTSTSSVPKKNALNQLDSEGKLDDQTGVFIMSFGRVEERTFQFQRPFTSYGLFRFDQETESLKKEAIMYAEIGMLTRNQLGKGKYGFPHVREVPAGDYLLQVYEGGNIGSTAFARDIDYRLSIKPGVINYAGEFLLTEHELRKEAIKISNQRERDLHRLSSKFPILSDLDVIELEIK